MSKTSWRALSALALGACAIAALSHGASDNDTQVGEVALPAMRRVHNLAAPTSPGKRDRVATVVATSVEDMDEDQDNADPFAPRGWQAEVTPVATTVAPVVTSVVIAPNEAPSLPTAPALPFTFMGRMSDGSVAMVYLSRGEESWTVKGGETLDGNYKIVAVNPQQIIFEHVPTGTQQILAIPEPDK